MLAGASAGTCGREPNKQSQQPVELSLSDPTGGSRPFFLFPNGSLRNSISASQAFTLSFRPSPSQRPMLPEIGWMIGLYVMTRAISFLTRKNERSRKRAC